MDIEELKTGLAFMILNELNFEFAEQHLAYNLINTIKVSFYDTKIKIEIPAPVYNIAEYRRSGTIEYRGHGSYANKLDERGSRWKHHKGYVDRCIKTAIDKWRHLYGISYYGGNINLKDIKEEEIKR